MADRPARILPVIVFSQFAGTALWFAGNAVLADLQSAYGLPDAALGWLTSAVQLGFIAGTLVFAYFALADAFSPRRIFLVCALAGAAANLGMLAAGGDLGVLLPVRFATGFFLAGIYPIGMKIASGWFKTDLGRAIGWLVGALVLGTALPHLIRGLGTGLPWAGVIVAVSLIAAAGGLAMFLAVPDGPFLKAGAAFDPRALAAVFAVRRFRASAFGYFGHMWELYAFWAFVPWVLATKSATLDLSLWSFAIIGVGSVGCVAGGWWSMRTGSARVAATQLSVSGACCLLSPLLFLAPLPVYLGFLLIWGIAVVGDSPQFSTLNAHNAPADRVGSALTIVNCIGFAITVVSIHLLGWLTAIVPPAWLFLPLAIGPAVGLWAMRPLLRSAENPM